MDVEEKVGGLSQAFHHGHAEGNAGNEAAVAYIDVYIGSAGSGGLRDLSSQNVEVSRQNGRCKFDPVHKKVLSFDPVPVCRQRKRDGDGA
jgi:hypothetical protein